jgi:hypothetical protein
MSQSPTDRKTAIAPMLSVRGGAKAVEFYKAAFGADEVYRVDNESGEVVARLSVDGAEFWVTDESPVHANFSPETLGGGSVRIVMIVDDPDPCSNVPWLRAPRWYRRSGTTMVGVSGASPIRSAIIGRSVSPCQEALERRPSPETKDALGFSSIAFVSVIRKNRSRRTRAIGHPASRASTSASSGV